MRGKDVAHCYVGDRRKSCSLIVQSVLRIQGEVKAKFRRSSHVATYDSYSDKKEQMHPFPHPHNEKAGALPFLTQPY